MMQMKSWYIIYFLVTATYFGQTEQQEKVIVNMESIENDECGNPLLESMLWATITGKVLAISNDNLIDLRLANKQHVKIRFAMVLFPEDSSWKYKDTLCQILLNQQVEILINPSHRDSLEILGLVSVDNIEINMMLIENGWGAYKEPNKSEFGWYLPCQFEKAELRAKKFRRGMWK